MRPSVCMEANSDKPVVNNFLPSVVAGSRPPPVPPAAPAFAIFMRPKLPPLLMSAFSMPEDNKPIACI